MPFIRCALLATLALLLFAKTAAAQSGSVAGQVTDQTGAALPGVTVDLATPYGERIVVTDIAGGFRFENVPAGSAELTFRLINFTVQRRTLEAAAGQSSPVNVVMQLSLRADIVVTGASTFRNIADIENPAEN